MGAGGHDVGTLSQWILKDTGGDQQSQMSRVVHHQCVDLVGQRPQLLHGIREQYVAAADDEHPRTQLPRQLTGGGDVNFEGVADMRQTRDREPGNSRSAGGVVAVIAACVLRLAHDAVTGLGEREEYSRIRHGSAHGPPVHVLGAKKALRDGDDDRLNLVDVHVLASRGILLVAGKALGEAGGHVGRKQGPRPSRHDRFRGIEVQAPSAAPLLVFCHEVAHPSRDSLGGHLVESRLDALEILEGPLREFSVSRRHRPCFLCESCHGRLPRQLMILAVSVAHWRNGRQTSGLRSLTDWRQLRLAIWRRSTVAISRRKGLGTMAAPQSKGARPVSSRDSESARRKGGVYLAEAKRRLWMAAVVTAVLTLVSIHGIWNDDATRSNPFVEDSGVLEWLVTGQPHPALSKIPVVPIGARGTLTFRPKETAWINSPYFPNLTTAQSTSETKASFLSLMRSAHAAEPPKTQQPEQLKKQAETSNAGTEVVQSQQTQQQQQQQQQVQIEEPIQDQAQEQEQAVIRELPPAQQQAKVDNPRILDAQFSPDGTLGWVVGENGLSLRTQNGGKTWETFLRPAANPDDQDLLAIELDLDAKTGFVLARNRMIVTNLEGTDAFPVEKMERTTLETGMEFRAAPFMGPGLIGGVYSTEALESPPGLQWLVWERREPDAVGARVVSSVPEGLRAGITDGTPNRAWIQGADGKLVEISKSGPLLRRLRHCRRPRHQGLGQHQCPGESLRNERARHRGRRPWAHRDGGGERRLAESSESDGRQPTIGPRTRGDRVRVGILRLGGRQRRRDPAGHPAILGRWGDVGAPRLPALTRTLGALPRAPRARLRALPPGHDLGGRAQRTGAGRGDRGHRGDRRADRLGRPRRPRVAADRTGFVEVPSQHEHRAASHIRYHRAVGHGQVLAHELARRGSPAFRLAAGLVQCLASPKRAAPAGGPAREHPRTVHSALVAVLRPSISSEIAVRAIGIAAQGGGGRHHRDRHRLAGRQSPARHG